MFIRRISPRKYQLEISKDNILIKMIFGMDYIRNFEINRNDKRYTVHHEIINPLQCLIKVQHLNVIPIQLKVGDKVIINTERDIEFDIKMIENVKIYDKLIHLDMIKLIYFNNLDSDNLTIPISKSVKGFLMNHETSNSKVIVNGEWFWIQNDLLDDLFDSSDSPGDVSDEEINLKFNRVIETLKVYQILR